MSELDSQSLLERFSEASLTKDERTALSGIEYRALPSLFYVNSRIITSCNNVQEKKVVKHLDRTEAVRRALEFFEHPGKADPSAINHIKAAESTRPSKTEFGQQYYRLGNEIVMGAIHKGRTGAIALRRKLDDIPDERSIIHIHNHYDDMPQSFGDLLTILADEDNIPSRCLYFAVGPNTTHLMFPTINSPRVQTDQLRSQLSPYKHRFYRDKTLTFSDIAKEMAEKYKLGFYSSPRGKHVLTRIAF